jgi:hypothetical protein
LNIKSLSGCVALLLTVACLPALSAPSSDNTNVALAASSTPGRPTRTAEASKASTAKTNPTLIPTSKTQATRVITRPKTASALIASATVSTQTYLPIVTGTPPVVVGTNIVADHTSVNRFAQIPRTAINAAAARKTLFMHQSTGGYIDSEGMECLAGNRAGWDGYPAECTTYASGQAYNRANFALDFWPEPQADALAKTDQYVDTVHARASNYSVIGMKFCYVDGWNQNLNVEQNYYINKMLALEAQYPGKTFIWTTSALWHDPGSACGGLFDSCQFIHLFNEQVRAYAKAHNKPLFDIADIESHDSNGNLCKVGGYEGLCAGWYDNSGGHPNVNGSIRLAKGFWYLMARISGWNGQ